MITLFKYDVAISVAEEDKAVADQVAAALKQRGVKYYYYKEWAAKSWGEYIINLSTDAYGRHARYVLMITSAAYVRKYWSTIERQIALANPSHVNHILQLKLDNTPVDGLSSHLGHVPWEDNPEEIAELLQMKVRMQRRKSVRKNGGAWVFLLAIVAAMFAIYFVARPKPRVRAPIGLLKMEEKILVDNAFFISSTEVTISQYRKFCEQQRIEFPPQPDGVMENMPVTNVSWYDAVVYCKSVGGRLPSDAEWELAAGAGLQVTYSGGNNASRVAVYHRQKPNYVSSKSPNAFGLYDMSGNVAEWCEDWFDDTSKSVRGGAYNSNIKPVNELAIAYRSKATPGTRAPYIGFRVVWDNK